MERIDRKHRQGTIWFGVLLLVIGGAWLLKQTGFPFPYWLFSWEVLVILIGVFIGFKNKFRDVGWLVMIVIGGIFLFDDLFPYLSWHHFMWPIALIILGLFFIFKARDKKWFGRRDGNVDTLTVADNPGEDLLDYTTVFGGLKKNVLTKNFRGGEVTNFFGGTELNFLQTDFNGTVSLEVTQVFGGTKLILPAHWTVKSEMTAVFAGIDDKRVPGVNTDQNKVLLLTGTSVFGGIEIISY